MAQIGKQEAQPFDELRNVINEIIGSARVLSRLWPRSHFRTKEQQQKHWEIIEKYEAVFWEGQEDGDPINPKLNILLKDIEDICKPILAGKGTIRGLFDKKVT